MGLRPVRNLSWRVAVSAAVLMVVLTWVYLRWRPPFLVWGPLVFLVAYGTAAFVDQRLYRYPWLRWRMRKFLAVDPIVVSGGQVYASALLPGESLLAEGDEHGPTEVRIVTPFGRTRATWKR